ncbi:transglycosylase SLT domain-containing protein [Rhodobacter sp. Har01]|nr:transglycosylase SLT domain-containing protein [Rhodobacter sp. Har01]MCB6176516.1 transglycosylase SLT domain-containing protein [Rhodobacter sp. Har01]
MPLGPAIDADLSGATPPMRWDHRPEAADWTRAALLAVAAQDQALASRVPADIAAWCPGYAKAGLAERRAFWVGLMSAVAKHESGWNPAAAGGGGRWIGLMQISPKTARGHGCAAPSAAALKDGAANLTCAVSIFAEDVARDGVVAGKGNRGLGRDWMPFRKADKRADMAGWTSAQPWCQAG